MILKKSPHPFFHGDDGRTCVDDFTAINNDHFYTGKIYNILIINDGLICKLHVCATY